MFGPEMWHQNVDDGFPEAVCRSFRKGFLTEDTYNALKSC